MSDTHPTFFEKPTPNYTPSQVAQIFEKSLRFSQASLCIDGLVIPEPVSYNANSILFKNINLGRLLIDRYRICPTWNIIIIERIGQYLGLLHSQDSQITDNVTVLGDLCPGNISITDDSICFFDFEPPPNLHHDFERFYFNSFYLDLASFILWMWIVHPLRKPYLYFKNRDIYIKAFLKGYTSTAKREISWSQLISFINSAVNDRAKVIYAQNIPGGFHRYSQIILLRISAHYQLNRLKWKPIEL